MPAPEEPLRTELVLGLTAFEGLAPGWDDLVLAMPRPSPFLLHDLCATWWARPEATALPVVNASAEPSVMREGRTLVCLKMDPGNWDRRLASLHFSFDEESLEQLSDAVQHALAALRAPRRVLLKAAN